MMGNDEETRRRKSTSSQSDEEDKDNAEANGLLGNGNYHVPAPSSRGKGVYGYRDRNQWIRPLSITFAILLLVTVVLSSCTILFLKPSLTLLVHDAFGSIEKWNGRQMLGIELHPHDH